MGLLRSVDPFVRMADTTTQEFANQLLTDSIASAISEILPSDSTTTGYLQTQIFPTLVPALEAYLVVCERRKEEGKENPEPRDWIGSYLMRHNPNVPSAVAATADEA